MYPLQVPGGIEIAVILLIVAIPVLFVVGLVLLLRYVFQDREGKSDAVESLEERVESLESEVKELEAELENHSE